MTRSLVVLALVVLAPAALAQAPEALRVADPADATRLRLDTRGGLLVTGTVNFDAPDLTTLPATGVGTRLMFWPEKAAFRAGTVFGTEWDAASVGFYSTALGVGTTASGILSTALGTQTTASGESSTALGYQTRASGTYSTALGWQTTASGAGSTAMGAYASANGQLGAFVAGDRSTATLLTASAQNQLSARFAGGYRLFTNSAMTVGAQLTAGATSWSTLSDSTRKEGFRAYDADAVLAGVSRLRLGTWNYRGQDASTQRHWGPMAQDFYREFGSDGVGTVGSDTLIATADADGVLFAAAQALEARTARLQAENEALRAELAALRASLVERDAVVAVLQTQATALREHQDAAADALGARLARLEGLVAPATPSARLASRD